MSFVQTKGTLLDTIDKSASKSVCHPFTTQTPKLNISQSCKLGYTLPIDFQLNIFLQVVFLSRKSAYGMLPSITSLLMYTHIT